MLIRQTKIILYNGTILHTKYHFSLLNVHLSILFIIFHYLFLMHMLNISPDIFFFFSFSFFFVFANLL